MRFLVLLAALFFAVPANVAAQSQAGTSTASVSEGSLAAARDVMTLLMVESGALELAVDEASRHIGPQLEAQLRATPFYARLSQPRRDALILYLQTDYPDRLRHLMAQNTPDMLDRSAASIAPLFSEEHMVEIAAFLRTEPIRTAIFRSMRSGVIAGATQSELQPQTFSAEEEAAFNAFAATPAGEAFNTNMDAMMGAMTQTMVTSMMSLLPALQEHVRVDICALLAEECPRELRSGPAPT